MCDAIEINAKKGDSLAQTSIPLRLFSLRISQPLFFSFGIVGFGIGNKISKNISPKSRIWAPSHCLFYSPPTNFHYKISHVPMGTQHGPLPLQEDKTRFEVRGSYFSESSAKESCIYISAYNVCVCCCNLKKLFFLEGVVQKQTTVRICSYFLPRKALCQI